jgi:uncharacterized protein YjdB
MKRTYLKVMPLAAAVLLATSCSKEDNNSADEIVNNNQKIENVVSNVKTLTINGKVKQGISKITTSDNRYFAFEGNETFTFGQNTDPVYGSITIYNAGGDFTATINYTDESELSSRTFIATFGSNPATISTGYDDLATAVQHAYYVIPFRIAQEDGTYKLTEGRLSKDAPLSYDVQVYVQSAFIKSLRSGKINLNNAETDVEINKFYVIPVGVTMGNGSAATAVGKVYTVNKLTPSISFAEATVNKEAGDANFTQALTYTGTNTVTYSSSDETVAIVNATTGEVTVKYDGTATITATVEGNDEYENATATYTVNVAVPEGFVDFGVTSQNSANETVKVYFAESNRYDNKTWNELSETEKNDMPKVAEWKALASQCYWVWGQKDGTNGIYAYKLREGDASNYEESSFNNALGYSTDNDPYIFLPFTPVTSGDSSFGYYWSSTEYGTYALDAHCLYFGSRDGSDFVYPESNGRKIRSYSVRLVRRSN